MQKTGIMLLSPGGTRYWEPCPEASVGDALAGMAANKAHYGTAWDDPRTVVEFGTSDGKVFTPSKRLRGPQPEPVKEAE